MLGKLIPFVPHTTPVSSVQFFMHSYMKNDWILRMVVYSWVRLFYLKIDVVVDTNWAIKTIHEFFLAYMSVTIF
jgi:hypothetical protein